MLAGGGCGSPLLCVSREGGRKGGGAWGRYIRTGGTEKEEKEKKHKVGNKVKEEERDMRKGYGKSMRKRKV